MDIKKFFTKSKVERIVAILAALILLQTLFFKFSGAPEAVGIFSALGVEPWGRYVTGILELIAGVALLLPNFARQGAVLAGVIMIGALISHATVLGWEPVSTIMALYILGASIFVYKFRTKQIKSEEISEE
jgi:uncharacterized membrane protein YphA (DoxX/SURF4 family)